MTATERPARLGLFLIPLCVLEGLLGLSATAHFGNLDSEAAAG